jgi:pathogenesis-related protein 1
MSIPALPTRRDASPEDQQAYLDAHNSVRAQHGAAALTWDSSLSDAAQSWGERCVFEHSGGSLGPFGENLFAVTGSGTPAGAVKAWTDEEGNLHSHASDIC